MSQSDGVEQDPTVIGAVALEVQAVLGDVVVHDVVVAHELRDGLHAYSTALVRNLLTTY